MPKPAVWQLAGPCLHNQPIPSLGESQSARCHQSLVPRRLRPRRHRREPTPARVLDLPRSPYFFGHSLPASAGLRAFPVARATLAWHKRLSRLRPTPICMRTSNSPPPVRTPLAGPDPGSSPVPASNPRSGLLAGEGGGCRGRRDPGRGQVRWSGRACQALRHRRPRTGQAEADAAQRRTESWCRQWGEVAEVRPMGHDRGGRVVARVIVGREDMAEVLAKGNSNANSENKGLWAQ